MAKSISKAKRARDYLLERIRSGDFRAGEQLSPERELARGLSMNTLTVRRALKELVTEGYILKQPRVGNFVNPELHSKKHRLVAVCLAEDFEGLPELSVSQFYTAGLRQVLGSSDFDIMVLYYDKRHFYEQALQHVIKQGCRVMITCRGGGLTRQDLKLLAEHNIFALSIGRPPLMLANHMHWVGIDEQALTWELVDGLWQRGHERILIARYSHAQTPRIGYANLHGIFPADAAVEDRVHFLEISNPGKTADISCLQNALCEPMEKTALIVPDELLAASVLRFSYTQNLGVPEKYSLISFQNYVPKLHPVPLTAVDTPELQVRLCREAGLMIKQHFISGDPGAHGHIITGQIHWTESVADFSKS